MRTDKPNKAFITQLPVDWIDTALVASTWETVEANLSGGHPAKLYLIYVEQTNNGATVEDIEVEIDINGSTLNWTIPNAVSGTPYYLQIGHDQLLGDFDPVYGTSIRGVLLGPASNSDLQPFTARTVGLIRAVQTTGVDAVAAQIEVNIVWDKLEAVI